MEIILNPAFAAACISFALVSLSSVKAFSRKLKTSPVTLQRVRVSDYSK